MRQRDFEMDGFFTGTMGAAKGVLIGGGLAQVGVLGTKAFLPKFSKYAGLIGAALGGGVSAFLMSKPQHREAGMQGLAAALVIGIPRAIEDLMLKGILKDGEEMAGLDAYTSELYGVPGIEIEGANSPIEILDAGGGSTGLIGAVTSEFADEAVPSMNGSAFGATGF